MPQSAWVLKQLPLKVNHLMNSINILPARTLSVIRAKVKSKHRKDLNTFLSMQSFKITFCHAKQILSHVQISRIRFFSDYYLKPHMINITNFIVQSLYQWSVVFRDINFFVSDFDKLHTSKKKFNLYMDEDD